MEPNKIYMPNELLTEDWKRHIEGEDTTYIRKDALLEWAKELKFHLKNRSGLQYEGAEVVIDGMIEKIESL